jgi:hypothetical protein
MSARPADERAGRRPPLAGPHRSQDRLLRPRIHAGHAYNEIADDDLSAGRTGLRRPISASDDGC